MIMLLIQNRELQLFIYLLPNTKIKVNLSVTIPTTTTMIILLMSAIGLDVVRRDNFHLVLGREYKQKRTLPTSLK